MIANRKFLGTLLYSGLVLALAAGETARADVRLPALFTDNLVLQQGMKVPVWGWADEGEEVTVTFRGKKEKTVARGGKWLVKIGSFRAGDGKADTLVVTGKNRLEIRNVLVGEVWLASGQSNMAFPLRQAFEAKADIEASANPMIRLFHVPKVKAERPLEDVKAAWTECGPTNVTSFSAVAYYFGRSLQSARGVPVGLIEADWGGSPAEVWMKEGLLAANPRYRAEILDKYAQAREAYEEARVKFERSRDEARAAGTSFTNRPPNGPFWRPAELYNGMLAPLMPYGIKGAIWYQGEANAERAEQYRSLFPDMIRNWRSEWCEGDFTFLAVQLAPFKAIKEQPSESSWAELREAQLLATRTLPNVGLAVVTFADVPNHLDIHPNKKKPVGERLALAARGLAYGDRIVPAGPLYRGLKIKGGKVTLSFDNVGSGLEARDGALKGFAICGEDRKFVWADAKIQGRKIVVSSPSVASPVAVRYGWADCPVLNLWNKNGLPAFPFRTDDFPMLTAGKK